jgi:hypothetical protein
MIVVVTGFVAIPDHPRSEQEYKNLGAALLGCDFPVMMIDGSLECCWLAQFLRWRGHECTHSIGDNPKKNTLAYHIVQAQKTAWLAEAAVFLPTTTVLVWIDYGIFHLKGVTRDILHSFVLRARNERAIAIPGCWGRNPIHDDAQPNWRFCGGTMVVPREHVEALNGAVRQEYVRNLMDKNHVAWDVNIWARAEENHPELPIWWYKADHDVSMFTNYRVAESVDVRRAVMN